MHHHTLAPIETARDLVARERDELSAERQALLAFADRVADIEPRSPPVSAAPDPAVTSPLTGARPPGGARIRDAYRDTVMAVDHYAEAYGEPLEEHISAELGPDVAAAVCDDAPLAPPLVSLIDEGVRESVDLREGIVELLDVERRSLERSREAIVPILDALETRAGDDRAGGPADAQDGADLDELETRLESLLDARTDVIQDRSFSGYVDGHTLCSHLYRSQSWTYPVLSVAAVVATDLRAIRRDRAGGSTSGGRSPTGST